MLEFKDLCFRCVICGDSPNIVIIDGHYKLMSALDHLINIEHAQSTFTEPLSKHDWFNIQLSNSVKKLAKSFVPKTINSCLGYATKVPIMSPDVATDLLVL